MVNLLPKAIPSLAINGLEFLQNWWLLALGLACLVGEMVKTTNQMLYSLQMSAASGNAHVEYFHSITNCVPLMYYCLCHICHPFPHSQ